MHHRTNHLVKIDSELIDSAASVSVVRIDGGPVTVIQKTHYTNTNTTMRTPSLHTYIGCPSFGTVCFGACVIAFFKTLRTIAYMFNKDDGLRCLITVLDRVISYFNR